MSWLSNISCYRWTQTNLFIYVTCVRNWFGWRRRCTKHSFLIVLEVFPVYGWFAWSSAWCSRHWRYIQTRGKRRSYGSLLCRKQTFIHDLRMSRPDFRLIRSACLDQSSLLSLQVFSFFLVTRLGASMLLKNGCLGWITHSYSWRAVHVVLGLLGLIVFTTIYFLFPETIQPGATGIEKMKAANGIDSSTPFIFINPFKSLWLLRSPSMLLTVRFYTLRQTPKKSLITSKGNYNNCISVVFL